MHSLHFMAMKWLKIGNFRWFFSARTDDGLSAGLTAYFWWEPDGKPDGFGQYLPIIQFRLVGKENFGKRPEGLGSHAVRTGRSAEAPATFIATIAAAAILFFAGITFAARFFAMVFSLAFFHFIWPTTATAM